MKPVLVFRHVDCEGPGYLAAFFEQRRIPFELIRIDAGEPVPKHAGGAPALVFMGGHMSVNDPLDWITAELDLIRDAISRDIPVLGHCLGGQLIAHALGASVTTNPVREIGWHTVRCLDNPEARTWFGEDVKKFDCFHWHGETFSLPEDSVPLLSSEFCDNQAFCYGKTLAMQCHIEMTADMIRTWSERFREQISEPSDSVQSAQEMLIDVETRIRTLNRIAERVYEYWLKGLRV